MKKAKKWAAIGLTAMMAVSAMAVPAYAGEESGDDFDYSSITGKVYWLNQKPEDGTILEEELIPAMGCTEPIAIALAAAKAREILGEIPENCQVEVSGNIIKNVKAVTVPNTGGLKGIEAAAAAT